jgi:hypothetical protein
MKQTSDFSPRTSDLSPLQKTKGIMLSLRSIRREAGLVQGQQLDSTRKILHGLKATQDDAVPGTVGTGHPESQGSEVRG